MFRYRSRSDGSEVSFRRRPADIDEVRWELIDGDDAAAPAAASEAEAPAKKPARKKPAAKKKGA